MNKIVLEHYPAAKLPDDLRRGIPAKASVKVTIEEEPRRTASAEEMFQQWKHVRNNLRRKVSIEEAVSRIRELRDEWDDE